MPRPALAPLARRVRRGPLALTLFVLITLAVGYVGQGSWGVGKTTPTAVGIVVTDVVGGAGSQNPLRVNVSLAVSNFGTDPVRVIEPEAAGTGTRILNLSPSPLLIDPGVIGRIDADTSLDCGQSGLLRLPELRLELRDGIRRGFPIGGSGMLLEACSRAAPDLRPLAAATSPEPAAGGANDRLTVQFTSPTGRPVTVLSLQVGGVALPAEPASVTIAGKAAAVVRITAPKTCPSAWSLSGVPNSLTVELLPEPDRKSLLQRDFSASVPLRLGPPLTEWLLARSCPEPQ